MNCVTRGTFDSLFIRCSFAITRKPLELYLIDFDEIVICCRASKNKRRVFFLTANIHFKGVKTIPKVHHQNHISLNISGSIEYF